MKLKEDSENHSCERVFGKAVHTCTDSSHIYCCYCGRLLLESQVEPKTLDKIYSRGRR